MTGLHQSRNTFRPALTYICKYYFIVRRLYEDDLPFKAHLKVRVINDQHSAQVEFRNTFQSTGRNLSLCTLYLPISSQRSHSMVSRIFRIGNQVQVANLNFPKGIPKRRHGGTGLRSESLPFFVPILREKVPLSYPF